MKKLKRKSELVITIKQKYICSCVALLLLRCV